MSRPFSVESIRKDFPILDQEVNGQPLVYLDNAATSQKPLQVIQALDNYYQSLNANVHRGAHYLSDKATEAFEDARTKVQSFVNARRREEIVWTRGTTESINLVANTWGDANIQEGDEIIVSTLEHHSNIVPWQLLCHRKNATLQAINVTPNGALDFEHFKSLLSDKTKLVAIGQISNALGVINPVREIIELAHQPGAKVLVDGAQGAAHGGADVQQLDCDFYAFSGHKVFAPTGIGALYARYDLLDQMPPWHGGGEMIERVSFNGTTFNKPPFKFEAGTPNIAGAIGMGAALDYLAQFNIDDLKAQESDLIDYAHQLAAKVDGFKIEGYDCAKTSVLSFNIDGVHSSDLGMMLDQQGIAVRTGHHCAMPLMDSLGVNGTVRASFSFYNTRNEIDKLFQGIEKALTFLR